MFFFFSYLTWNVRIFFPQCSMNILNHVDFVWAVRVQWWYICGLWTSSCFSHALMWMILCQGRMPVLLRWFRGLGVVCPTGNVSWLPWQRVQERGRRTGTNKNWGVNGNESGFLLCLSAVLADPSLSQALVMTAFPVWHLSTAMLKGSSWHVWGSLISPSLTLTLWCVISAPRQ